MRTVEWQTPDEGPVDPVLRSLPAESNARKATPITTGVLDYFPAALAAVARVSKAGNDKHNPGQPLHHSRGKSADHADSAVRHIMERGGIDPETGQRYSAQAAWRVLAMLQQELEDAGEAPMARGARYDEDPGPTVYDLEEAERLREAHSAPATVADIQSRNDYNEGIMAAARIVEAMGFSGIAEDIESLRA